MKELIWHSWGHNSDQSPRHITLCCLPLCLWKQTRIQTAPWMTGTATTEARPVTVSRLPSTPPPNPTLQCTSIPWGNSNTDTPTLMTYMSWTTTTEPWGNETELLLFFMRLPWQAVRMYQQQVEKGLILVRQEEKKHQMNCKMMTMYYPILIILKHLSLRQLSPDRRPCFVSFYCTW